MTDQSYENDNNAYAYMREHGIHRQKKSGPRKGQWIHETVGGKPFSASAKSKALEKAKGAGSSTPGRTQFSSLKGKKYKQKHSGYSQG